MFTIIVYGLLSLIVAAYAVDFVYAITSDAREPPMIHSKVPLFGHLYQLLTKGVEYWSELSMVSDAEMYTVRILWLRIYVCNSRRLLPVIQRHAKTLSFTPVQQLASKKYGTCSDHTHDLLGGPMAEEVGTVVRSSLAPGSDLDDQNLRTGNELLEMFDRLEQDIARSGSKSKPIRLLRWTRHFIVHAAAQGIYGATHPYKDPVIEDSFWIWHDYINLMVSNMDIFAGKGWSARGRIFDAFRRYFADGVPSDSAAIIRNRREVFKKYQVIDEDAMKLDTSFSVAVFSNTAPTAFWFLWETFSRANILEQIRAELLSSNAVTGDKVRGFTLNLSALKHKCPLLLSMLQETQRIRHVHANIRRVLADTILDGQYLLKKGNFVQMPGAPIHHSEEIYGSTCDDFDPYRFIPKDGERDRPASSFLAWGAPPHLCPARQFATTELLLLGALLFTRFDMLPADGNWTVPDKNIGELVTVLGPKKDVDMAVRARPEYQGSTWTINVGESKSRISLASG